MASTKPSPSERPPGCHSKSFTPYPYTMRSPNPEQAEALKSDAPQKLVIAGAGSGKTSTLCWQIAQDIKAGNDPRKMVAITFTNAAAREYAARLGTVKLGYMGTLHGWCLSMLNRYGSAIGYKPGAVSMIDEETETALIKAALFSIKAGAQWSVEKVREWKASGKIHNPAAIAAKKYMAQLRAASCVDFDSVLFECLRLIEGGHIPQLDCLYWDEFQDSGPWDNAIMLAIRAKKKFVVGDPDQSVYGFRGSSVEWILELSKMDGWATFYLVRNHRSTPDIVAAANQLISGNTQRLEKAMVPVSTMQGMIQLPTFTTPLAEAAWIAGHFKAGALASSAGAAVLVRYNAQIPILVASLEAEGFSVVTPKKEKETWVPLAVSALNALHDPENNLAAMAWLEHINRVTKQSAGTVAQTLKLLNLADKPANIAIGMMKLPPEAFHAIVSVWVEGDLTATAAALSSFAEPEAVDMCGKIYVGTIHSFKGQEAGCVVLAGMSQAAIPGNKSGEELEEERRLFYVGITRAKRYLIITAPGKYTPPFGVAEDTKQSQFIHEAFPTE